jgi:hypothetical protein
MKNVKQFIEFLNEGFVSKKDTNQVPDYKEHEDNDIAEQILSYIKSKPDKVKIHDKYKNSFKLYWKASDIEILTVNNGKGSIFQIKVDDEKLDVSFALKKQIVNECEKIEKDIENKKSETKNKTKKDKLSKFRTTNFENNEA